MRQSVIYLDYAAATPIDTQVFATMQPYLSERFYNPSATYAVAEAVRGDIEAARARVAHWLGVRPVEVVFTAGGTEANNLAIRGVLAQFPGSTMVTTAIEHESVLATAHEFGARVAPVSAEGVVDRAALAKLISDQTVLVSVMYANNEVGTIQPIRQIAQTLESIRKSRAKLGNQLPLYLHTDAAQAGNYLDLHAARLGVDLLTVNAGKIYGPKQTGALFVAAHVRLHPQITGGGQERAMRSGTENVAGIVGFAAALDMVQSSRREETARIAGLQRLFFDLLAEKLPRAVVNGSRKTRLPNNVHVTFPGQDNERLIFALDEAGIQCAAGSACSASSEEPSHVLRAMGLSDADARASLRFTFGRHTTEKDIRHVIDTLRTLTVTD
ncbi:MAG TPA: cysteine desulfurase family protein [Candidatus Saccharimonadales bacterium]|nr:cysteine desulfurase family protein [Candidatus Saccharimonadales bacterium]